MLYMQAVSKRDESNGNDRYGVLLSTCSCRLLWSRDYKFRCHFLVFHQGGDDGLGTSLANWLGRSMGGRHGVVRCRKEIWDWNKAEDKWRAQSGLDTTGYDSPLLIYKNRIHWRFDLEKKLLAIAWQKECLWDIGDGDGEYRRLSQWRYHDSGKERSPLVKHWQIPVSSNDVKSESGLE